MKELARKVWNEQSACLGFVGTAAILAVKLLALEPVTVEDIPQVLAPLAVGVGARKRP